MNSLAWENPRGESAERNNEQYLRRNNMYAFEESLGHLQPCCQRMTVRDRCTGFFPLKLQNIKAAGIAAAHVPQADYRKNG